jgi:cob(I)alamin adenosyltransferase
MKLYTGTGDRGKTSLFSGERTAKNDARVDAYGDLDELNAVIGALAAALPVHDAEDAIRSQLNRIQSDLLHAGAWLATTPESPQTADLTPITTDHIHDIEAQIDAMQAELPELKSFILPGGHPAAAWAHMARTVCRRAERKAVALAGQHLLAEDAQAVLVLLNRLSDYFFMLSRLINHRLGITDETW